MKKLLSALLAAFAICLPLCQSALAQVPQPPEIAARS